MPLPDSLHDDFADGPALYRRQREIFRAVSEREWREARACYYALVTELDERFGMLLDGLEAAGEAKNTIVIVLGDHGRYMGAHGFDAHNFAAFEEAYHIPLIVSGPGIASGLETDALVSLADVCPTLLEIAGAPPIDVPDSRSFATLLSDPAGQAEGFDTGYAEYHGGRFVFTQRVLWQGPWKFVFNGFDFDELYNLDDDPYELTNLARDFARDPAHQERIRAMMTEMWRIMRDTGDRAVVETHYPPMRVAAVGPKVVRE